LIEECERKKKGKDEEIKVEAIRPFGQREKEVKSRVW